MIFCRHAPMDWPILWLYYNRAHEHWSCLWQCCCHALYSNERWHYCDVSYNFEIDRVSCAAVYWMLRPAQKQHHTSKRLVPVCNSDGQKKENISENRVSTLQIILCVFAVYFHFRLHSMKKNRIKIFYLQFFGESMSLLSAFCHFGNENRIKLWWRTLKIRICWNAQMSNWSWKSCNRTILIK